MKGEILSSNTTLLLDRIGKVSHGRIKTADRVRKMPLMVFWQYAVVDRSNLGSCGEFILKSCCKLNITTMIATEPL